MKAGRQDFSVTLKGKGPMSTRADSIPRATISRLSVYLQELDSFLRDGTQVISSEQLAKACHVNATQIRKDLTYFGEFGVRGVGYEVQGLMDSICKALGIDRPWNAVVTGVGSLGQALLRHKEFSRRRFHLVGAFDVDPERIGMRVGDITVQHVEHLPEFAERNQVQLGLIATPAASAQLAADRLVNAGVRGILSYAPARLFTPQDVFVEYVDFFHHLYSLAFNLSAGEELP